MVEESRIQVHQGVTVERFTEDGVILSDGSKLLADVVIFASVQPSSVVLSRTHGALLSTGYTPIREASREIFGDDVIDQVGEIFGLDEEGEIKGGFRPCGYPGVCASRSNAVSLGLDCYHSCGLQLVTGSTSVTRRRVWYVLHI